MKNKKGNIFSIKEIKLSKNNIIYISIIRSLKTKIKFKSKLEIYYVIGRIITKYYIMWNNIFKIILNF